MNIKPSEFVEELNQRIIGQDEAKRTLAIALRNRWRRTQLNGDIQKRITPKNILMIGPTGVGKTAIIKAMADMIDAPLLKVEATRYTQVGYVGESVNTMIKELIYIANSKIKAKRDEYYNGQGKLNIDLKQPKVKEFLREVSSRPEIYGNRKIERLGDLYTKDQLKRTKERLSSLDPRIESIRHLDKIAYVLLSNRILPDKFADVVSISNHKKNQAIEFKKILSKYSDYIDCYNQKKHLEEINLKEYVETKGIIFIDEIDKIASKDNNNTDNVGKIGVQRDLLALLDGTTIGTPLETIDTENILFIVAGAFHVAEVTDLIPELLGRLPIKVNLKPITEEIMVRILKETIDSPIKQYKELLKTDGVNLIVTDCAIKHIAKLANEYNETVYSMGARTLHYICEKVFAKLAFDSYRDNITENKIIDEDDYETIVVDEKYILDTI